MGNRTTTGHKDALTSAQLEGLLRRLGSCAEQAGDKYEEVRRKLVKFFQWNSCLFAEDLADETLNRVARKLEMGTDAIPHLEAFIWGVARNIKQEAYKADSRMIRLPDLPEDSFASEEDASLEELRERIEERRDQKCLRLCLRSLNAEDRALFLEYRPDKPHHPLRREELARMYGLTPVALRVRVNRVREKLRRCIYKCRESTGQRPFPTGLTQKGDTK